MAADLRRERAHAALWADKIRIPNAIILGAMFCAAIKSAAVFARTEREREAERREGLEIGSSHRTPTCVICANKSRRNKFRRILEAIYGDALCDDFDVDISP